MRQCAVYQIRQKYSSQIIPRIYRTETSPSTWVRLYVVSMRVSTPISTPISSTELSVPSYQLLERCGVAPNPNPSLLRLVTKESQALRYCYYCTHLESARIKMSQNFCWFSLIQCVVIISAELRLNERISQK